MSRPLALGVANGYDATKTAIVNTTDPDAAELNRRTAELMRVLNIDHAKARRLAEHGYGVTYQQVTSLLLNGGVGVHTAISCSVKDGHDGVNPRRLAVPAPTPPTGRTR